MKERLGWIDIAKGFCLLAVIIGHMGIKELEFVYSFHLTTFFILSGYTIKKVELSAEYLNQKFKRLMVPYFITCFAVVCMDVINSIVISRAASTQAITDILYKGIIKTFFAAGGTFSILGINLGKGIGAIWFLPAMFFALILIQLILKFKSKVLQFATTLVMFAAAILISKFTWLPFSFLSAMFATPFILIGKFVKEFEILSRLKFWHYLILFIPFAVGCYFNLSQPFYMVGCNAKHPLLTPIFAVCSSLCVIGASRLIKRFPPLEYIGKNSLIFLCVHLFEMNTISPYFRKIRSIFGVENNYIIRFLMDMLFITLVSFIIIKFSLRVKQAGLKPQTRDSSFDIFRAFLIILMIIGHVPIDYGFRTFIYSFHMMAFVMASGYFYKSGLPLLENLKKTFKLLSHYVIFAVLYLIFSPHTLISKIQNLIFGISYVKKILPNATSIGPVYFILLLFIVRFIYVFVDLIRNEWLKNLTVIALFIVGFLLGKYGYWLPWTIDGALVSLMFYHIAHYIKKFDLLKKYARYSFLYFPLVCVWIGLIFLGGMEIALRKYGNLPLLILGTVSAFLIMYSLCRYLAENLPKQIALILTFIGQSTAYILIFHTIFGGKIRNFASINLGLNPDSIFNLAFYVIVQVAVGTICYLAVSYGKKCLLTLKRKN